MIYLFSKKSCGPCMLVDKYLNTLNDSRQQHITYVDLEDVVLHHQKKTLIWQRSMV